MGMYICLKTDMSVLYLIIFEKIMGNQGVGGPDIGVQTFILQMYMLF